MFCVGTDVINYNVFLLIYDYDLSQVYAHLKFDQDSSPSVDHLFKQSACS